MSETNHLIGKTKENLVRANDATCADHLMRPGDTPRLCAILFAVPETPAPAGRWAARAPSLSTPTGIGAVISARPTFQAPQ